MILVPSNPNDTLFAFESVTAETLELDRPALILMAVRLVATLAVRVDPLSPKLTPFESLNVIE